MVNRRLVPVCVIALLIVYSLDVAEGRRALLSDPGISIAVIEDLPSTKPLGFTYEPVSPYFYQQINNLTFYEFNGTYYEELNGTFVPAIASTVNGTFTLQPSTQIEASGLDGTLFFKLDD